MKSVTPDIPVGKSKSVNLKQTLELLVEKALVLTDANGTPVAVGGGGGHHHGGHGGGGFRTFDPRDMYWGPRIDVDDDGQPILVGGGGGHHHGGHGGGGRGWGGFGAPWGGMWYPPMWQEVEIVSDEDIAIEKRAKKEAK